MNDLAIVQVVITSLFGLSLFIRLWEHTMSVFVMLLTGTVCLFMYEICPKGAVVIFCIASVFVTFRGAMKPKGEKIWV